MNDEWTVPVLLTPSTSSALLAVVPVLWVMDASGVEQEFASAPMFVHSDSTWTGPRAVAEVLTPTIAQAAPSLAEIAAMARLVSQLRDMGTEVCAVWAWGRINFTEGGLSGVRKGSREGGGQLLWG